MQASGESLYLIPAHGWHLAAGLNDAGFNVVLAPADARNLWPEPRQSADGWSARQKDQLEAVLNRLVCSGGLLLRKPSARWPLTGRLPTAGLRGNECVTVTNADLAQLRDWMPVIWSRGTFGLAGGGG